MPRLPDSSGDAFETCLQVLDQARNWDLDDPRLATLERAVDHIEKGLKKRRRRARRRARAAARRELTQRAADLPSTDEVVGELVGTRACYVCGARFREVTAGLVAHCRSCATDALARRQALDDADFSSRRAVVTGGRIKVGRSVALALLRGGAHVVVTTRFPAAAGRSYAAESDFDEWRQRLTIIPADFRAPRDLVDLLDRLLAMPPIDIVINNAALTIRRPDAYYREIAALESPGDDTGKIRRPAASALTLFDGGSSWREFVRRCAETEASEDFPSGQQDVHGQPIDLRQHNSWTSRLDQIAPAELVEVLLIGCIAPFVLASHLKPSLVGSPNEDRYIINVAASEGQFSYSGKTVRHPHTNMAKAALNMLTRTSAEDYAQDGIYMVSADPGWVSDENMGTGRATHRGLANVPLTMKDAASRILEPVLRGMAGSPVWGVLLKDYREVRW